MKYDKNKISIVIPSKNEADGLSKVIKSLKKYSTDIVVVDGHSTDNTKEICKKENVRYFLDSGKGKGAGVRLGISKAKNNYVIIFDADGSPDERDIPKLFSHLTTNNLDMVIASRRTGGSFDFAINPDGIMRTIGSDTMTLLVNAKFKTNFSDILYCYRIFKKSSFKNIKLTSDTFDIEQEMLIKGLKKGLKIDEYPSRERARAWGKSKLKTSSGLYLIYKLFCDLYL